MSDKLIIDVIDMTEDGKAIGKTDDNFIVFTDSALPGDKVEVKIKKRKKNYAEGITIRTIHSSEFRQENLCITDADCGGCDFTEFKYNAQKELKQNKVNNMLSRISKLDIPVNNIITPKDINNYRNKVILHIDNSKIGYYSKKSNKVINMKNCIINSKIAIEVKLEIEKLFNIFSIHKIDDLMIRNSKDSSEVMIVFISKQSRNIIKDTKEIEKLKVITEKLKNRFENIKSVLLNINDSKGFVLGKRNIILYGNNYITDYINSIMFKISPETFFQINPEITKSMYKKILEYCDLKGDESVYDIYSGIGTISLFLAEKAKSVTGIEIVEQSIKNAIDNARLNNIENVIFEYGKAEDILPKHASQGKQADVIVVDPPRKGCEKAVLEAIINMSPKKVVYVSCNPSTLARDLKILSSSYSIKEVQPFDMFPYTNHVEAVVLLEK